jgi:hypothetical protein
MSFSTSVRSGVDKRPPDQTRPDYLEDSGTESRVATQMNMISCLMISPFAALTLHGRTYPCSLLAHISYEPDPFTSCDAIMKLHTSRNHNRIPQYPTHISFLSKLLCERGILRSENMPHKQLQIKQVNASSSKTQISNKSP